MQGIYEILTELGYTLTPDKDGWRTNAIFRGGTNRTAIKIFKKNGNWCDFVESQRGTFEDLIKLTLGENVNVKDFLKGKIDTTNLTTTHKPQIKIPEIFDKSILKDLIPDHSYLIGRGISLKTCNMYGGGLCLDSGSILGKLKARYVMPVWDSKSNLVGLVGRDITNKHSIKYKILGNKQNFVYNAAVNGKFIQESREVFLVESQLCSYKLTDLNIRNNLVLFGTECSYGVLNYLLKLNLKKIYICLNNEPDNDSIGNKAAEKVYSRLKRYFNQSQLKIYLPPAKDFADIPNDKNNLITNWYEDRNKI
jgi:hypothetical protein